MSPPTSMWRVQDVPDDPDKHQESDCRDLVGPAGVKILGARVRGKKHKHEGTNCDDWFEFAVAGPWTLIAVSDGAGSKKFSRVGALASTGAAIESMKEALEDHQISPRDDWGSTLPRHETTLVFADSDVEHVQLAMHKAMRAAYEAVRRAADLRAGDPRYSRHLPGGRNLDIHDLSATLLLAVHTTIRHEDQDYSFVMACQVGDGMTAVLEPQGRLTLLGVADSGDYSGETEFLTSERNLARENLARKTRAFRGPLRALMVMTDGVADDYFPNDPGLLRLYGDLMLNGILGVPDVSNDQIATALEGTALRTIAAVEEADFRSTTEPGRDSSSDRVLIGSIAAFAERLNRPLEDVLASSALLRAGQKFRSWCKADTPPDRLRLWLDSYYVRGSFDDRTLVILSREALS